MDEVTSKIASIFAQSMADAAVDEVQLSESKKIDEAIKIVKSVLDKAHAVAMAEFTSKPLHNILSNYRREDAIRLLQEKLKQYEKFINMTTPLTRRHVVYLPDPYADKSDEDIKTDISFTIFIIYFAAAMEDGSKAILTKIFKGLISIFKGNLDAESGDDICRLIQRNLGLKI